MISINFVVKVIFVKTFFEKSEIVVVNLTDLL